MEGTNEISRIGVQFGEDFNVGPIHAHLKLHIHKQAAEKQLEQLNQQLGGQIDPDWKLLIGLSTEPGQQEKLKSQLDKVIAGPPAESEQIVHTILNKILPPQNPKTFVEGNKVYISFGEDNDLLNMAKETFSMFFDAGLSNLSEEQSNTIDIKINSNQTGDQITHHLLQGERIIATILRSLKAEIRFDLNKQLAEKLSEIIKIFDAELANSPPLIALKYFKNLNVDLRFNSAQDLPDVLRKNAFLGKFLQKASEADRKFDNNEETVKVLLETLGSGIDMWFSIQDFAAIHLSVRITQFSAFFREYGGLILSTLSQI